jgi:hypothetical protein
VAIAYYFMVYSKIRRTRRRDIPPYPAYTPAAPAPAYVTNDQTPPVA